MFPSVKSDYIWGHLTFSGTVFLLWNRQIVVFWIVLPGCFPEWFNARSWFLFLESTLLPYRGEFALLSVDSCRSEKKEDKKKHWHIKKFFFAVLGAAVYRRSCQSSFFDIIKYLNSFGSNLFDNPNLSKKWQQWIISRRVDAIEPPCIRIGYGFLGPHPKFKHRE